MTPERYKMLLVAKYDDEDRADKLAAQYMLNQIKANSHGVKRQEAEA